MVSSRLLCFNKYSNKFSIVFPVMCFDDNESEVLDYYDDDRLPDDEADLSETE